MRDRKSLIRDFKPWFISALKNHINSDCSVVSFPGAYNINNQAFQKWIREIPEMRDLNQQYLEKMKNKRRGCS